jgi:tetratricopeptide (TPR) repeat protein
MTALAFSQGDAGRESPFSLGAGARGMGMGRSFVSLSGGASSAFSNPAATALLDQSEFTAFHTSLFMGTNYDCLALSHPVGTLGVFTISAGRLGTGSFTGRDEFNRPSQSISASEFQLGISYGRELPFGLATGLSFKGAGQELGDNTGYGFGLDWGLQYRPNFMRGLTLGTSFNDLIQPRIKLVNSEDKFQTISRFGASYSRSITTIFSATAAIDLDKSAGRNLRYHPGLEAGFYDAYFLRVGYDKDRPTFGAGIVYNIFRLDYAYENIEFFGGSHRVSLSLVFGHSARKTQQETIDRAIKTEKDSWQKSLDVKRGQDFASNLSKADSLAADDKYQDAMGYYQRALALDESSQRARIMSDSMINLIITSASTTARDEKRADLIEKRIASALEDFKAGRFSQAIVQYELALDIDPGNKTVNDLLSSARTARQTEIDSARNSARALTRSGDYAAALLEWNKILLLDSADQEAKTNIDLSRGQLKADALIAEAVSSINKNKYADAVTFLQQAQIIRPSDSTIKSLLENARAKSAPKTNLSDIKSSAENWAIYLKGLESYQASDYKSALSTWESLQKFYPNNPDLEKNISQARQRLTTEGGKSQD